MRRRARWCDWCGTDTVPIAMLHCGIEKTGGMKLLIGEIASCSYECHQKEYRRRRGNAFLRWHPWDERWTGQNQRKARTVS